MKQLLPRLNVPRQKIEKGFFVCPPDIESPGNNHFICKCMDVTRSEACASIAEGFDQVETLKRFTSMGMGRCQGKACYEAVARLAARDTGLKEKEAVPTTMRPPATPISFGVLAGRSHHLVPLKRTPMHDCHQKLQAKFLDAGAWKRPESYTSPTEEVLGVRNGLGIIDVSTLGKVQLSGPDVLKFLHFLLPGKFAKLSVGKTRYCVMVREDGILFEDGTLSQVEQGKYYLSTTTGNQDAIVSRFWWWLTTENYDVRLKNLSATNGAVNVTGARSREFLQTLTQIDLSNDSFPYMHCRKGNIANVPVILFRIGFTGELGYEIHFPAEYGESLWDHLLEQGIAYGMIPFGVETQRILRLEKGHLIPGIDTDALTNPYQAGVGFAVNGNKPDFIGKAFLNDFKHRKPQERLVAYQLSPGSAVPTDGVAILHQGKLAGRVTSSRLSPTMKRPIGLAFLRTDLAETGNHFSIRLTDGQDVKATVLPHGPYDPEGARLKS